MQNNGEPMTKSYLGLNSYKLMGAARTRPRTISFVRKGLIATQMYPSWNELGCRKKYRKPCRIHRSFTQYG